MNMFKTTSAKTPEEYISLFPKEDQKELKALDSLIKKTAPDLKPHIVSGMIGYGSFHYKSKSGREGDWPLVLLARQKNYFSLYACSVTASGKYVAEEYKNDLPKADVGKSCIRFKKLSDLDTKIIEKILRDCVKYGGAAEQK